MIGTNSSFGDNGHVFGECLQLPYYCGPIENWMVAMNGLLIAVNIVSAVITIVANTVFLVTYAKTPSLKTSHYFFLMLLAITDISVGLVSQPLFTARKIMEMYRIHNCVLWMAMRATVYYFSGISFLTLTLVSVERYLAVCRPLKHRCDVTPNRMAFVAFVVWALWLSFPILRFSFSEYYKFFGMFIGGIILVLFFINGYLYVKIHQTVSEKKVAKNEIHLRKITRNADLRKEARMAKTVACLLLVMILAYLPTAIGLGYKTVYGVNTAYLFGFLPFADTMVLVNSSFNPLFYCYRNVNIRLAIWAQMKGTADPLTRASSTTLDYIESMKV